jgi:hypothetical protein
MSDFVPADMLTFEISSRGMLSFMEDISEVPTVVRGAYFVSHTADSDIDFAVRVKFLE